MKYTNLFRKIPIPSSSTNTSSTQTSLSRTLKLSDVLIYGVGASVGAGIYSLIGIGASLAGPAVTLSFLVCGIACMLTALSFAEFASSIPVTGSAYSFAYVAFGELPAWIVGWNLCLEFGITAAVVARSWAEYVVTFLSSILFIPSFSWEYFVQYPIYKGYTCSPLSTVIVIISTWVLLYGVQESTRFNNIMVLFNLSVLSFVVLVGFFTDSIHTENLTPYMPHGISGVNSGAAVLFFSYIGFDMVACLSEEVINPKVVMPIGIIGSLFLTMCIYLCVAFSIVTMAPLEYIGQVVPISNALLANACCTQEQMMEYTALSQPEQCLDSNCEPLNHPLLLTSSQFISGGAIFGLTTAAFTSMMGQPRIAYRIAKDGLLPPMFAQISTVTHVPTIGILINGFAVAFLACFVNIEALANTICLGTLQIFTFVNAAVIIQRFESFQNHPNLTGTIELEDKDTERKTSSSTTTPLVATDQETTSLIMQQKPTKANKNYQMHINTSTITIATSIISLIQNNKWNSLILLYASIILLCYSSLIIVYEMTIKNKSKQNQSNETFQCPGVPYIPLFGIICNSYMMGSLPIYSWYSVFLWIAIGLIFYFSYGYHYSLLNYPESKDQMTIKPQLNYHGTPVKECLIQHSDESATSTSWHSSVEKNNKNDDRQSAHVHVL